jgi:hypothetical protein
VQHTGLATRTCDDPKEQQVTILIKNEYDNDFSLQNLGEQPSHSDVAESPEVIPDSQENGALQLLQPCPWVPSAAPFVDINAWLGCRTVFSESKDSRKRSFAVDVPPSQIIKRARLSL